MVIKTTIVDGKEVEVKLTSLQIANIVAEYQRPSNGLWYPKEKEPFFFVDFYGRVDYAFNTGELEFVNPVFATKEEADRYAEYLKAKCACEQFIAKHNNGWVPDWSDTNQLKYFVVINREVQLLYYDVTATSKFLPNSLYFKDSTLRFDTVEDEAFITMLSY